LNILPYIRKVQFYETDQMGVVHHANYVRWFEEARVDLMEQIGYGYDRAAAADVHFAVIGVQCDYKSMARFGETVRIATEIPSFSATRMTISYKIADENGGTLRVAGETRHCFYNTTLRTPVSLKKALPDLFDIFQALARRDSPAA